MSELRSLAREAASSLADSSRALTKRSLLAIAQSEEQSLLLMPGARLSFRIYFNHTKSGGFLWFRKKTNEERSLIDASIDFELLPSSSRFALKVPSLDSLRIDALLPHFLKLPSVDLGLDSIQRNEFLAFQLPAGAMVVRIGKTATPSERDLRFFAGDGEEYAMKKDGKWRVAPFLHFLDEFEGWLANPREWSQRFELNDLSERFERNDFGQLAKISLETVLAALDGAAAKSGSSMEYPVLNELIPNYAVDEAKLQLVVMLEADGTLPEWSDKETYQMKVEIELSGLTSEPVGTALLFPPDFVVSGDLREQFLELLGDEVFSSDASVLSAFGNRFAAEEVSELMRSDDTRISIFRTVRKRRANAFDTDTIVVRGNVGGTEDWVFLVEGRFRYSEKASSFEFDPGSAKGIVATPLSEVGYDLDDRSSQYFFRLMRALRRWIDLLE